MDVFDSPSDIGYTRGKDGNRLWFFKDKNDGGASFGLSVFGARNVGWIKTFFHVNNKLDYINSKGIHVETVANSAEQSLEDSPGANPDRSNGMPYAGNLTDDFEKSSAEEEKNEDYGTRHFSLVRNLKKKRELDEAERRGDVLRLYRAAQLVDGKLYPPMAARIEGEWVDPIQLGKWEQADDGPKHRGISYVPLDGGTQVKKAEDQVKE